MSPGGWIILSLSIGGVCGLFTWCVLKILRTSGKADPLCSFEIERAEGTVDREPGEPPPSV